MTHTRLAAIGLGVGLLAGTAAGLVVNVPGGAGASDPAVFVTQDGDTTTPTTTAPEDLRPEPGDRLRDLLAPLVDDGTLTAEQVDAIVATVRAHRPDGPRGGWHGHHGRPFGRDRFPGLSTAADVIGIDVDELRSALRDGQTVAEIAQANGVDPQEVIDALVAEAEARITALVNEGPQAVGGPTE